LSDHADVIALRRPTPDEGQASLLLPIPSVFAYVLVPNGVVKYFGGTPSKSAAFWCATGAGSGDALVAMMCGYALLGKGGDEFKKIAIQGFGLYSILHFGGFWWHHTFGDPHPQGPAQYILLLTLALAAAIRWGRCLRPSVSHPSTAVCP
jgi:hypothetical protein